MTSLIQKIKGDIKTLYNQGVSPEQAAELLCSQYDDNIICVAIIVAAVHELIAEAQEQN